MLHDSKDPEIKVLHKALNTALIIAYSRSFSGNKKGDIPSKFLRQFTDQEKALHRQITNRDGLRNQFFAHSDSDALAVRIHLKDTGPLATMHNPSVPLSITETRLLLSMIEKLLYQIESKIHELQSDFSSGTRI